VAFRRIHVIAGVEAPNRDWAATLPNATSAAAAWDRCFEYAWLREPRCESSDARQLSGHLRPLQVVRVRDEHEQIALERQAPRYMRLLFVRCSTDPDRLFSPKSR